MTSKICSTCKITKELTEFYKDTRGQERYRHNCKLCCKIYHKKYNSYPLNKVKNATRKRKCWENLRQNNPEKYKDITKKSRTRYKEKNKDYNKKYRIENKEELSLYSFNYKYGLFGEVLKKINDLKKKLD